MLQFFVITMQLLYMSIVTIPFASVAHWRAAYIEYYDCSYYYFIFFIFLHASRLELYKPKTYNDLIYFDCFIVCHVFFVFLFSFVAVDNVELGLIISLSPLVCVCVNC